MTIGFRANSLIMMTVALLFAMAPSNAQRYMEKLDRGLIAVNANGGYYLSWRLFGTDPQDNTFGFNIYKGTAKLTATPITGATCFQDNSAGTGAYTVRPVTNGVEGEPSEAALVLAQEYLSIPLDLPSGYSANDASCGDLDGDGQYEIVLHVAGTGYDNSQAGISDPPILDAYKLNGARLWRINLGKNIREGAHYTQFIVYDLDGDGCAEVACKTAPGTRDGTGGFLKTGPAAGADNTADYRITDAASKSYGYVLSGPEWYTIFDGKTGRELVTVKYKPARYGNLTPTGAQLNAEWGDSYGNRVDRFLASVAYLDGERPSVVPCRGYYTRTCLWALDWRGGKLTERWYFDTDSSGAGKDGKAGSTYEGQGCHSLRQGDVDGDGFDEIVYGACTIDHDGKGLYNTRLGHGDALHLSDLDPGGPGLEVWQVHEDAATNGNIAASFRDAKTGQVIWSDPGSSDNGRGCTGPLVAGVKGWQMWSGVGGLWNVAHMTAGNTPSSDNFTMWWGADLTRATENGTSITPYSGGGGLLASGCSSNNGTKSTPCLTADLFGDWREEVVYGCGGSLRIYTTTTPTTNRLYTLMHDPIYRMSVATENVGYNQPPEPGIYIGPGMTLPEARPNIKYYPVGGVGTVGERPVRNAGVAQTAGSLKVFSDRSFAVPGSSGGMAPSLSVYNLSGKLVTKTITRNRSFNLRRDFGFRTGVYLVRIDRAAQ